MSASPATVHARGRKFRVPAEVSVRPVQAFDAQGPGWCAWHPHDDVTHIVTVLVEGHVVIMAGCCDQCTSIFRDGTDWNGPARAADRAVRQC